jgi:hypothetical protein
MPGHIGTDIVNNTRLAHGSDPDNMTAEELDEVRATMRQRGFAPDGMSDGDLQQVVKMMGQMFRDSAPMTAAQAATVILDGVRAGEWRILVGDDAHKLDEAVRADPHAAYGPDGLDFTSISSIGGN